MACGMKPVRRDAPVRTGEGRDRRRSCGDVRRVGASAGSPVVEEGPSEEGEDGEQEDDVHDDLEPVDRADAGEAVEGQGDGDEEEGDELGEEADGEGGAGEVLHLGGDLAVVDAVAVGGAGEALLALGEGAEVLAEVDEEAVLDDVEGGEDGGDGEGEEEDGGDALGGAADAADGEAECEGEEGGLGEELELEHGAALGAVVDDLVVRGAGAFEEVGVPGLAGDDALCGVLGHRWGLREVWPGWFGGAWGAVDAGSLGSRGREPPRLEGRGAGVNDQGPSTHDQKGRGTAKDAKDAKAGGAGGDRAGSGLIAEAGRDPGRGIHSGTGTP